MIRRATHYKHTGFEVYDKEEDKRRWFVWRQKMDFDDGTSRDLVVIQVLRLMKYKDEELSQWHFSNRLKKGSYERLNWPYKLSAEISQVIMNCVEGEDLIIQDAPGHFKEDKQELSSKDLTDVGI